MTSERTKPLEESEVRILAACSHRCCLCREDDKDLAVHVLDENNAVALCDDCLQRVKAYPEGRRSVSPEEIRVAKRVWEAAVRRPPESVRDRDPREARLFSWGWRTDLKQIDLMLATHIAMTACEVLASADDLPRATRLLGVRATATDALSVGRATASTRLTLDRLARYLYNPAHALRSVGPRVASNIVNADLTTSKISPNPRPCDKTPRLDSRLTSCSPASSICR